MQSSRFPHDLDFRVELNPALFQGHSFDFIDQSQDIRRGCSPVIHNKVSMYFGNAGLADGKIFQAEFIDQFSGRARAGILENAPGTRLLGLRGAIFSALLG